MEKRKILLVDDEVNILRALEEIITPVMALTSSVPAQPPKLLVLQQQHRCCAVGISDFRMPQNEWCRVFTANKATASRYCGNDLKCLC